MDIRTRINNVVEQRKENKYSRCYDLIMLIAIVIGVFPLMFRSQCKLFWNFDIVPGVCFIIDYIVWFGTS